MSGETKNNNKKFLIAGIVVAIAVVAFLVFRLGTSKKHNTYSFVPKNAVLVWESNNTIESIGKIKDYPVWQNLSALPFHSKIISRLKLLDSLDPDGEGIKNFFRDKAFRASMHITARDNFDFVFYLPIRNRAEKDLFNQVLEKLNASPAHILTERAFQKTPITTIVNKKTNEQFAFINYQNHIIGSMTPFLVEDVIRHVNNPGDPSFYDINRKNFEVSRIKTDDGDIYLNYNQFAEFLKCFINESESQGLELLKSFGQSAFYDLSIREKGLFLNGSGLPSETTTYFLDIFRGQQASGLDIARIIPINASAYYGFSFTDGISFRERLREFLKVNNKTQMLDTWYKLSVDDNIHIEKFFEFVAGHFAYIILESQNSAESQKLFYVESSDPESAMKFLQSISEKFSGIKSEELPFRESYAGSEIYEMMKPEFPSILFSEFFTGFSKCYYMKLDNYIVFANDVNALRNLNNDVQDEKVWGKSVKQNLFLENLVQKTNVNIIINTSRSWKYIKDAGNEKWAEVINTFAPSLKRFEMIALQYAFIDDKFYTGAYIQHKESGRKKIKTSGKAEEKMLAQTGSRIVNRPKVVRSHLDNSFEVLVQDDKNNLSLISKQFKPLWSKTMEGRLLDGSIHQVDLYKNGKLQYAFADAQRIYVIDRNGNKVDDFPVRMTREANQEIRYFNVLDYDNTKEYRFIISDNKGRVYITDKTGRKLEGWDPLKLEMELAAPPRHARIGNRDVIILLQKNGKIDLRKRNGMSYPNFPLDLYNRVDTDYFVKIDKDFETSKLFIVDEEGLLKELNFEGHLIREQQIFKPSADTRFELIRDGLRKSFVIARKDGNKVTLLNSDAKELFGFEAEGATVLQYYNFGADNEVYPVLDQQNNEVRVYKSDGSLLTEAFASSNSISLLFYDSYETYHLYKVFDNEVALTTFESQ